MKILKNILLLNIQILNGKTSVLSVNTEILNWWINQKPMTKKKIKIVKT